MVITSRRAAFVRQGVLFCVGSSTAERLHTSAPSGNDEQEGGGSTPPPRNGRVSQLVSEPGVMSREVAGSNPAAPTIPRDPSVQHRCAAPGHGARPPWVGEGSEEQANPVDGQGASAQAERFDSSSRGSGSVAQAGRAPGVMSREVEGSNPSRAAKLFAVGRRDLKPGLRVAQMFHALRQFAADHPYVEDRWFRESNTIVLLEVEDGDALEELAARIRAAGVTATEFSEPDFLDVGITALALGPDACRLVSNLPLALKHE